VIFVDQNRQTYMKISFTILIFTLLIILGSCGPIEKLPPEPAIEFRTFELSDTIDILGNPAKAGKLTFYFEDGDGDVGLTAPDSIAFEPGSNLFLQLYRKTGGIFELAPPSDPLYPSEYRIPYLNTPGQNKILKGRIEVTMIYFLYNDTDTLYYDFWIKDRSGNESNTATTCVVVLGDTGTCGDG
jgi:hypothetical protein